jgi:hypothetical protein
LRRVFATIVAVEKQWILRTQRENVFVAIVIQHAVRMSHIVFCGLSGCIIFFHFISQRHHFRKKKNIEHKMCVLISSTNLFKMFLILRKTGRDMIKNVCPSSCTLPVILVRFWWNLNYFDRFSKNTQIQNLIKIPPMGAELFHVYGRTDVRTEMTQLIVAFRNFANAPKKW